MNTYMTTITKNEYIDKLGNTVNKYNNTYHRAINMKLVDVASIIYIDFNKENNKEVLKTAILSSPHEDLLLIIIQ